MSAVHRSEGSIDVFWSDPDPDEQWQEAMRATRGEVGQIWPHENSEWSEHYYIDELPSVSAASWHRLWMLGWRIWFGVLRMTKLRWSRQRCWPMSR